MIIFIYGTTAEAIKLAPIARRLDERKIPYQQWLTFQHTQALADSLPTLGLPKPDRIIANGNRGQPLRGYSDVLVWLFHILGWVLRNAWAIRRELPKNTIVIVHGDTMTSVVGAVIARLIGAKCAHVEAGLRSGNWRHPFPEEIDRRIVGVLASIHYTPSLEASANLKSRRGIVFTHGNSVVDAVLDHSEVKRSDDAKFGVVLLHRFELISNKHLVEEAISTLGAESRYPLKLLVDAYSQGAMEEAVLKLGQGKLTPQPKLRHEEFVQLLKRAEFIITDSGGIQEETALLGVPTLVHRKATERGEGLGKNVVLSEWKTEVLIDFLKNFERYRQPIARPKFSPSGIIVDDLIERGYAQN
ncbi:MULTISPECIES: UDP-N-acetylglucosamine 2-epimerase [unclassified Cryobacterium]|uniref:UDP-N-acetylglucosamine 2-epimerase n=1 Tax=unclassified Cryobacterium TaxID=2649013 RepID=UPI002AB3F99F|nr:MULTISPECIES: UDP-N-acetylglucosamine 2-epimerase [unclassified Cryobacterium]MDY7526666.1 UDP-N-acetylglucosamine 2-epimerase [Cryobacterium sp. 10C2]MDY7557529.1 UDP-N-acetylglucosamine 2-epimerase [Cryobacterium sp. 10C3]MEB0292370.1 UDP-N-acetylglucosamine 2-epimerase [Cryobacterium sp. 10C2]